MTETPQPEQPQPAPVAPQRDTTIGWLSHLLVILTGWVGPLILWAVKKDSDDKFGVYHAKQCWIWGLTVLIAAVVLGVPTCGVGAGAVGIAATVYSIIGLVKTSKGEVFKYWLVADKFCADEFAAAYPEVPVA